MTVSVVVPRSPGSCPHRDAIWEWLRPRWEAHHADWELVEGIGDPECWNKAEAVADGAARSSGDVVVIADADVFVNPTTLAQAVGMAPDGWVVPFVAVRRIDRRETTRLLGLDPTGPLDPPKNRRGLDRPAQSGRSGGGMVVASRADLDSVGWLDPGFVGWGGEDVSLGWALNTLTTRRRRLRGPLWHLWHPRSKARGASGGATEENRQRTKRYRAADGDPDLMRELIGERAHG